MLEIGAFGGVELKEGWILEETKENVANNGIRIGEYALTHDPFQSQ